MSMNLSSINVGVSSSITIESKSNPKANENKNEVVPQEQVDLKNEQSEALTYSKPKNPRIVPPDLETLMAESEKKAESLINLVRNLVEQQGLDFKLVIKGEQKLSADQASIDAAKEAIGEDGEFGVKKVAERILSFAKFAIGDDPSKLESIRKAVQQGFDSAKEALGGALPDISQQTYDKIMGEFDRWQKEGIPSGDTVSLDSAPASTVST
ncbi:hypothetical protein NT239_12635 [Chitinibacter sp. SCUT-21]|uniref:hypothetical protein n=1 Tax=Chitinibacter sp. SCUT-21 TaxID=2970891 RepID=UPI0035A57611